MANINNVTSRRDNGSMSSSFVEVIGPSSIITAATCSSTIREVLDFDTRLETPMSPIHEEPPYSTTDDTFIELCATCLHSRTKKEATHFCPGCDRRGRYMCGNCLKEHSVWCNKPGHEVQSLSVDRYSDTEFRYNTIEQSEQDRPMCRPRDFPVPTDSDYVESWLSKNSTESDSETSEGTLTQSKGKGMNLYEHHAASSLDMSKSDSLSFYETECRPRDFPVPTDSDYVESPVAPLQSNTKRENVRSWLSKNPTESDSETSEGTLTQSKGKGMNLYEHHAASSLDMSKSDSLSFYETQYSDTEYRYNTIEHSEQDRPMCRPRDFPVPTDSGYVDSPVAPLQSNTKRENVRSWLSKNPTESDSETSEGTLTQSKGKGMNLYEHHAASSLDMSKSDSLSFYETQYSDTEYRYNTIEHSEQDRPMCRPRDFPVPTDSGYVDSWLFKIPTESDSETSEGTLTQSKGKGKNLYEHLAAEYSDTEYRYNTIEHSEQDRPMCPVPTDSGYVESPVAPLQSNTKRENVRSWLSKNPTESDSETSEGTLTQSKGKGMNLYEHHAASSLDMSKSDSLSFYETDHIYCDPIEMLRLSRIPDPNRRNVSDPCAWEQISTATARRLNDVNVNKERNTQERLAKPTGGHKKEERVNNKKKSCINQ